MMADHPTATRNDHHGASPGAGHRPMRPAPAPPDAGDGWTRGLAGAVAITHDRFGGGGPGRTAPW